MKKMEDGSLLQVAVDHAKLLHSSSSQESLLRNCVILDLYSLGVYDRGKEEHLLYLAKVANTCNRFFQSKGHFWHYGNDGPVFGMHIDPSEKIPHLRAFCRYGPSVQDSWMAIRYVIDFIKAPGDDLKKRDIVASAWDVQDGQVILVQLANLLPSWLDEDSSDNRRYACWIDQEGDLQLLRKPCITLKGALQELNRRRLAGMRLTDLKLNEALVYWLDLNVEAASVHQRCPMVLPRSVARGFRERSDLLRTAIQAYCEHLLHDGPLKPKQLDINFSRYDDWVWTVQRLSRTNYAMARTVASSRGDWTASPDSTPVAIGVELKRYKRQCKLETSQHLKHAVALGIRAVAGLELLSGATNLTDGLFASSKVLSSLQERILSWDRIQRIYYGKIMINTDACRTIFNSFHLGPNKSDIDLTNVLKCPVFPEEAQHWTSYSNPQASLREQAKRIIKSNKTEETDEYFRVPSLDQVDGEDWMYCKPGSRGNVTAIESQCGLNNLLSRFQSFLNKKSGIEGITPCAKTENIGFKNQNASHFDIRPRIFLNTLCTVLKGEKPNFPTIDPYFHLEDYDLVEDEDDSNTCYSDVSTREYERSFQMNDPMVGTVSELSTIRTRGSMISIFDMLIFQRRFFVVGRYG